METRKTALAVLIVVATFAAWMFLLAPTAAAADLPVGPVIDRAPEQPEPRGPDAAPAMTTPATPELSDTATTPRRGPWPNRERPPFYFNLMAFGAVLNEDGGKRLTSGDSENLEGAGITFRMGGVVREHHLIGGLFQGYWRGTKKVRDDQGGDNEWGAVSTYHLGPEYRYQTDFGLYVGASPGLALILADNDIDGDEPDCDDFDCAREHLQESDDHGAVGISLVGTLGYEFRVTKWFAVNTEVFAGYIHALDEDEKDMDTVTVGLALGMGF